MNNHREIADTYAGEPCKVYTLNGTKDAIVSGRLNQYATVRALDGSVSIEVNWPTVGRKMRGDKLFYTC